MPVVPLPAKLSTIEDVLDDQLRRLGSHLSVRSTSLVQHAGPDRRKVDISKGADLETVNIGLWHRGVLAASGWLTPPRAAKALQAWLIERQEPSQMFPNFADLPLWPGALEHEQSAAAYVEWRWRSYLAYSASPDYRTPALLPLIRRASIRKELRQLFVYTSAFRLCFSRCTGFPFSMDCPLVHSAGPNVFRDTHAYTVSFERPERDDSGRWRSHTQALGQGDMDGALDLVVANLPPGAGPAVRGTSEDVPPA